MKKEEEELEFEDEMLVEIYDGGTKLLKWLRTVLIGRAAFIVDEFIFVQTCHRSCNYLGKDAVE